MPHLYDLNPKLKPKAKLKPKKKDEQTNNAKPTKRNK